MTKWCVVAVILIVLLLPSGCVATGSALPGRLQILSHKMIKADGGVKVQATVKNVGQYKVDFAEVTVNFYDVRGNLIETSRDAVINLKAGESWIFTITCSGVDCGKAETYDVQAVAGTSAGIR